MRRALLLAILGFSTAGPPAAAPQPSADSLAMLRTLDDAVRANPGDHAAWHQRGMLAWAMARAHRRTGELDTDAGRSLVAVADSSLRRASQLAEREPRYLIDLGRFRGSSLSSLTRRHASGMYERALDHAREQGDSAAVAEALASLGVIAWRRYESIADRHVYSAIFTDPDAEGLIGRQAFAQRRRVPAEVGQDLLQSVARMYVGAVG